MTIPEKLKQARQMMLQKGIDAWIIPGTDPHQSEYLPNFWNERKFMSGFTGSYGQIVITQTEAGLWTDSRYFIQAEQQLKGSGIKLYKLRIEGEPTVQDFILDHLANGSVVGLNALLFTVNAVKQMKNAFASKQIILNTDEDIISEIWTKRPETSKTPCLHLPVEFSGLNVGEKIELLRDGIQENDWSLLVTSLDEIAWLFNIRGSDIDYNPLVLAWAVVSNKQTILFIEEAKLSDEMTENLLAFGVLTAPYNSVYSYLSSLNKNHSAIIDADKVNQRLYQSIAKDAKIVEQASPIALLKSKKNKTELAGIQNAMLKDGVALVQFLMQFEEILKKGDAITEYQVGELLKELRSKQANFHGESFCTIAGYNENGAIVHYSPSKETSSSIKAQGILLFDSGAQYYDGTTDITRTISLDEPKKDVLEDFTLVLKGVIALSSAVFPKGTTGIQLDVLARNAMWKKQIDYGHGTGHGVGHFLNVHEGPQTIRKEGNMVPLEEGMLITVEPGIYKTGRYGIRTENMLKIESAGESEFGNFLQFKTLTLCPIDKRLVAPELLTNEELNWLNDYHKNVFEKLSPYLSTDETKWLKLKTDALNA